MRKEKRDGIIEQKDKAISLRRNHICRYNDYTVCEYSVQDGRILSTDGGLLQYCGLSVPESLHTFRTTVGEWPVEHDQLEHMIKHVEMCLKDATNDGRVFADVEVHIDSEQVNCWISLAAIRFSMDDAEKITILFVCANDKKLQVLQLIDKAESDSLTGAVNRKALQEAVDRMTADGGQHAFIMLDIDGFKKFNDTFGHVVGDEMLINIVSKIKKVLRNDDTIGRIGGDEFMICLSDVYDMNEIERLADQICIQTRHSMENGIYVSASLGISVSPRDGTTFEELYRKADIAMYRAKHRGGDRHIIYNAEMTRGSTGVIKNGAYGKDKKCCTTDISVLVTYNFVQNKYTYPEIIKDLFLVQFDDRPLCQMFCEDGAASIETADKFQKTLDDICESGQSEVRFEEYYLRTADGIWRWYRVGFIKEAGSDSVSLTLTDIHEKITSNRRLRQIAEFDELTGLLTARAFYRTVENILSNDVEGVECGEYAVIYFDIIRFKAINDMFGMAQGDQLLLYISDIIARGTEDGGAAGRLGSDRFMMLVHKSGKALQDFVEDYFEALANYDVAYEIVSNVGIYVVEDASMSADAMLDRAILALSSIKGSYLTKYCYYNEELRKDMLSEQEIVGMMTNALAEGQFHVYYQPQYNHSTGELVGAEALIRWCHPQRGMIMPGTFIPIFERNGFISKVDFYVFEQVCSFLHKSIESGLPTVPVSVNISRGDIFQNNFVEKLEVIRKKYDVPVELLRLEITESTVVGSNLHVSDIIDKLHQAGYVIEMDDFGNGYSSLNVLKDIKLDILKLDMQFLSDDVGDNRGGTILSMVIRMARWLGLPVIAEGIETVQQADFLKSIGCNYIQGYYYAKPMTEGQYEKLVKESQTSGMAPQVQIDEKMDPIEFWNPDSLDTLIFSNYVGGATIFDYHNGRTEIIRVNKKFLQEIGGNFTEEDVVGKNILDKLDKENKAVYIDMLTRAIESSGEEECETWRLHSNGDVVCLRSSVRVIGRSKDGCLFYEMVRNVTAEKLALAEVNHREKIFRAASEQANIYYWEYIVATKEMRPCFRCVRDLGLSPLVENYPEPAIEMGIFPPEVADVYRDMHRQIENGAKELEAEIPLTMERIPFIVRYTTEFDEEGKPVKAYGSAIPVKN